MDVKRKADKIFSAEEQRMILRREKRLFQTSKCQNEIRNAVFCKSTMEDTRNLPPDEPIPRHAIANRRWGIRESPTHRAIAEQCFVRGIVRLGILCAKATFILEGYKI